MNIKTLFRKKSINLILKEIEHNESVHGTGLIKNLTVRDLTAMGIAAVIGAGIFSTIGKASFDGGPAVSLLFIFTAVACAFSALCYAQFAATIPISGSAYTYAYASFGELVAWIIGWALIMEYAVGNIVVAISWSDYFTGLMAGLGLNIPVWLTMGYQNAAIAYEQIGAMLAAGGQLADATPAQLEAYQAWMTAPLIGNWHLVIDLPAFGINFFITVLVYIGIKESKTASNILVLLKMAVVLLVIAVGVFYVDPANWSPFAPNGVAGVLKGVSAVFFAYIGFDAISTTAEECKNPQRDMPRAMIYALIICTVLYVIITLVLTGIVSYRELEVGDPLAYVFEKINLHKMAGIVAVSAVFAMASVLLVFQIGQPRIWMSMSRDGLLPKAFSRIHPRFNTPGFSTIVTGLFVGIPALFLNMGLVTDLTSIGTLFAFALVCGGILLIDPKGQSTARFKVPYIDGKFIVPVLLVTLAFLLYKFNPAGLVTFFNVSPEEGKGFWETFQHKIPILCFLIMCLVISWLSYSQHLSLIPVLGLLINLYLMTELGITNWLLFFTWLLIGLVIYFAYGYKNSRVGKMVPTA